MSDPFFTVSELTFLEKGPYSFTLMREECVGLSGPSGVGKTQLFRALTDLIPSTGTIALEKRSRETIEAPLWRTMVTLVPSESLWWYDRVDEHFQTPEKESLLGQGAVLLGLERTVGAWQVSRLSTGEKQRLALLRAVQCQPKLLLLDEPTSGLDPYHTEMVEAYIRKLRDETNVTVMWVSHDRAQITRVADRVLFMSETDLQNFDKVNDASGVMGNDS